MREQCSKGHELVAAEFVFYKLGFVEKADFVVTDTHNLIPVVVLNHLCVIPVFDRCWNTREPHKQDAYYEIYILNHMVLERDQYDLAVRSDLVARLNLVGQCCHSCQRNNDCFVSYTWD